MNQVPNAAVGCDQNIVEENVGFAKNGMGYFTHKVFFDDHRIITTDFFFLIDIRPMSLLGIDGKNLVFLCLEGSIFDYQVWDFAEGYDN